MWLGLCVGLGMDLHLRLVKEGERTHFTPKHIRHKQKNKSQVSAIHISQEQITLSYL